MHGEKSKVKGIIPKRSRVRYAAREGGMKKYSEIGKVSPNCFTLTGLLREHSGDK